MLKLRHNQRGFTMIELLIGLVVIAILFSVGAPSFMTWTQNSQIRTAAESLSDGLQLARAEAVRRNTNVKFTLSDFGSLTPKSTWVVGCSIPDNTLNPDGEVKCPTFIQQHLNPEGTPNAIARGNIGDVTFNGLGRASNSTTSAGTTTMALNIAITNPTGGECQINSGPMRCLNVVVATGGQVRMCNPAIPSTNPQGC